MIVREVMMTKLITVTLHDTLSHGANLLRQYQFHHLPVVRPAHAPEAGKNEYGASNAPLLLEGLLTSNDIDLAVELERQRVAHPTLERPWQERQVVEVMHRTPLTVTPTTSIAAAAQIMVERGLTCLPVVAYGSAELASQDAEHEALALLVGLLTRSDLLIALAHLTGAFEPGMHLLLPLPPHDVAPLAHMLLLAADLHIQVPSVVAGAHKEGVARVATVFLSTMYPAPLLKRLQEAGIEYCFAGSQFEEESHVTLT